MVNLIARVVRGVPGRWLLCLGAVLGVSTVRCAMAQEDSQVTVQVFDARTKKELSLPERITSKAVGTRKCSQKKSAYAFKGKATVNSYPILFRADSKSSNCKERFPLLALYNIPTRGGTMLEFRGELVPSGINDGKYEGLMIQQTGSVRRKPDFYLKVLEFPVTDK